MTLSYNLYGSTNEWVIVHGTAIIYGTAHCDNCKVCIYLDLLSPLENFLIRSIYSNRAVTSHVYS